jgi:predicted RNA-binding protein with RPS1 domain
MLATGQIVEVDVHTVETFGIFCRYGEQDVLVLIPETSWIASYNSCRQFAEPGDRLTVKIVHVDAATGKISASIKSLHPDPWGSGVLEPGTIHRARVIRYVDKADRCKGGPGYLLELVPGAYVMLCAGALSFDKNQQLMVTVGEADFSRRAVEVAVT